MAKRTAARRPKPAKSAKKRASAKRPSRKIARKTARPRKIARASKPKPRPAARATKRPKASSLDRTRRMLEETVQTPPSSLNMDRHGSAARSGRARLAENQHDHAGMEG